MINIEDFDSSLLKIDQKSYKNIGIYNIGYITIKQIGHIEENNRNKYLVFDSMQLHSTDENKEVLKKYKELWDGIKSKLRT